MKMKGRTPPQQYSIKLIKKYKFIPFNGKNLD